MLQSLHFDTPCLTKTWGMTDGIAGISVSLIWTSGVKIGNEPLTKRGCNAGGISKGGKLFTSGLLLDLSTPGVDFGVGLERFGLLLLEVSSCLRFGEIFIGELLE